MTIAKQLQIGNCKSQIEKAAEAVPAGRLSISNFQFPIFNLRSSIFRSCRAGLTLAEMLIALAIVALLLAAVAVAMKGSLHAYAENAKIAQVTQSARVIVNRMLSEIRTADAVDIATQQITITPPANAEGVTRIIYELSDGTLYYRRTVNGSEEWNTLIDSDDTITVDSLAVVRQTAVDGEGQTYTTAVNARLVLKAGNEPLFVSASTSPRRAQSY